MSRAEDLKEVERQIGDLEKDIQSSVETFRKYNEEVTASIRSIMEDAGVWDEVNSLETERSEAQQRLQNKVQQMQNDLQQKRAIKEFLESRAKQEKKTDGDEEKSVDKPRPAPPA